MILINIKAKNIYKIFNENQRNEKVAVNNFTYSFCENGFYVIEGDSGSGKSTLLNILSCLDSPSAGQLYYGKTLINKLNKEKRLKLIKENVGFVFQKYYLNDSLTIFENVLVSLLIRNFSLKKANKVCEDTILSLGIKKNMFKKKPSECSGGEKQRVAIARTLVYSPSIIFLDEPTGALDRENSLILLEIIKKISKNRIVICVSHDKELVESFADKILFIKDGCFIKEKTINKLDTIKNNSSKFGNDRKAKRFLIKNYFKIRKKEFAHSFFCISIAFCFLILCSSFYLDKNERIISQTSYQFDYPTLTLTKEEKRDIEGTNLKLSKTTRPSLIETNDFIKLKKDKYYFDYNFDYLFLNHKLSFGEKEFLDVSFSPVFSFSSPFINEKLLIKGELSSFKFENILINDVFYSFLKKQMDFEPLNSILEYSNLINFSFYDVNQEVIDNISFNFKFKIIGVVKEFSFLNSKKIYYSHSLFTQELSNYLLNNISSNKNEDVSILDYYSFLSDLDYISMYSYRLFLKNIADLDSLKSDIKEFNENNLKINSLCYEKEVAFINILDASTYGLLIFLIIAFSGVILYIALSSLLFYFKEKKNIAINMSLGFSFNSTLDVLCFTNIVLIFSSISFSFLLSAFFKKIINKIIFNFVHINNFLSIPFFRFKNIPFIYPFFIFSFGFLLTYLSTKVPLMFTKKISIKEELNNGD